MTALNRVFFVVSRMAWMVAAVEAQEKLPSGQEVVDRFVEVTGGKERYEAVKTMTAKGTLRVRAFGSEGTIEMYFARPDKARLNFEIAGVGKIEKGNLGKVAWEMSPVNGNRLVEGAEAKRLLEGMNMKATYDPASIYESLENTGVEEVDGTPCYKVAMKRMGSEDLDYTYYAVESGLAVKSVTHEPTQLGSIVVNSVLSKYEESGGIKSAMSVVQELVSLGMTQEIEFESVEYDKPILDSTFELPEEIKELVSKSK